MTSETAAQGPEQDTATNSEGKGRASTELFSSPAGDEIAEQVRPPKTTTSMLIDPFSVPTPQPTAAIDTDSQHAPSEYPRRRAPRR